MKTITWFCLIFFLILPYLVKAQPAVNLGADTILCSNNNLLLDAGNTGASFLWSTGEITQTINVDSSATYWVDVTDMSGTTRDSIVVTVLRSPIYTQQPSDTTVCGGILNLTAIADTGTIVWMDSMGNTLGYDNPLSYNVTDTATVWYQATYLQSIARTFAQGGSSYPTVSRGIIFDVAESIHLNSVKILINGGPFTADIELENSLGSVIASKSISYGAAGTYEVFLDFDIPVGTNYTLYMRNINGAGVRSLFPFPNGSNNWSQYNYGYINLKNGTDPTVYPIFWEWKVTRLEICNGPKDSVTLNMLPTPIVDFGPDTVVCGDSLVLTAFNTGTGFSYLWDNGATTAAMTVTTPGLYQVTVSSGGICFAEDSVNVTLKPRPALLQTIPDTSLCQGWHNFTMSTSVGTVLWKDPLGILVGVGDTINYELLDTTTLYYQSAYLDTIGRTFAQGAGGYPTASRGIIFDVAEPVSLTSVMIQINNGPFTATVELENSLGTVIATKNISYNTAGTYEVFLNFDVPIGTNYTLYMRNISGAGLRSLFPFPNGSDNWSQYNYGYINLKNSTDPTVYPIFWEWKVARLDGCYSAIDSVILNKLPSPVADLGLDTVVCGDSLVLTAFNAGTGFTYLWENGATTATLTVWNSDVYKVTVSSGGICFAEDSVNVTVRPKPTILQTLSDTSLCQGIHSLVTNTNAGTVLWEDPLGTLVGVGDTINYELLDTTTLYYQSVYLDTVGRTFAQGAGGYPTASRGIIFDVAEPVSLTSVMIQINNGPFTATVELENSLGTVIATKNISYNTAGTYEVFLNFDVPIGTNYTLYMRNISGAGLRSLFPFPNGSDNWSQYNYGYINLKNSTDPTVYPIFWEWKVARLDGCYSAIDSVTLNRLPTPIVDLGLDTILCEDTLVLDATNAGIGYNYQWSTNASTSTIQAFNTDLYKVTVTLGGDCPVEDSLYLTVNPRPRILQQLVDTSLCQGIYDLTVNKNVGVTRWIDATGNTIALKDTFTYELLDTTTLYYQSVYLDTVGRTFAQGAGGYPTVSRGIIFDVTEPIRLNSVMIQINNGPFTATVELENAIGTVIATKNIAYNAAGIYEVFLDFDVPIGNDYTLYMRNISGAGVRSLFPFPNGSDNWSQYNYGYLNLKNSTDPTVYPIFWEWKVTRLDGCYSNIDSVTLNSLPTPTVDLGMDTVLCGGGLTLDATNVGTNYLYQWNTTASTPTIFADTTGWYKVTVSFGGDCLVEDSLNLLVKTEPILTQHPVDTILCSGWTQLVAGANVGLIRWTKDGNTVGYGDSLLYNLTDTTTLHYEASYFDTLGRTFVQGGSSYPMASRGIIFDVNEPIRLNSVHININGGPFTATVELENALGTVIASKNISYSTTGTYEVFLDFDIPVGVNYTLYMRNINGGGVYSLFPFPNSGENWNQYNYGYINLKNSTDPTVYPIFWEWKVTRTNELCSSRVDSVLLNRLPTPVINLPLDTVVCNDSVTLNVFFPNATYNWSVGGNTSSSLLITQEGTYSVTATIGDCFVEHTIDVYLEPEPTVTLVSTDTITCAGVIPRIVTGADFFNWYTEPIGGNYLGYGSTLFYNAQTSDTIWVEGQNFSNQEHIQGWVDTFSTPQARYDFPNQARGLVFDVHENLLLKDVTMYISQTSLIGTIELWDENGITVHSQSIVLTNLGENIVPLNFEIPVGNNYKLMLTSYNLTNSIPILSEYQFPNFPVTGDYVTIRSGTPGTVVYQYFYKWNVQTLSCASERMPTVVDVLPTPNINFPVDTIICGDTLILDASSFGALSYAWSTGETTASVILDSSMTVSLLGTTGSCSDFDSVNVFVVEPPSLIIPPNDTTICEGNAVFYASGNAAYYAWYNTETGTVPFALGDSIIINIQDTTTLWVEGIGFIPRSTSLGETYNPNSNINVWGEPQNSNVPTRGMAFNVNSPILLNSVMVYVDTATTATLTISKTGFPYYTKAITLGNVGANIIQIDTLLEAGNYSIELGNKSQGKILYLSPYSNTSLVSLNTPEITFVGSVPTGGNQYYYFFDWKISTPSCASTRLPVEITVPPSPNITMVADTATCTLSSIVLDPIQINNSAYTYAWSDVSGSTSDTLIVTSSGYYKVTVTNDSTCSSTQDIYVQFLSTPTDPVTNDFTICSPRNVNIPLPTNDGIVVWYDSSNLNNMAYLTAPYNVYIGDTTDFWVDVAPKATTRIGEQAYDNPNELSSYFSFIISNTFDVHEYAVLDSVAIYVETAPSMVSIELMDASGNVINTANYTINQAQTKSFIPLDFLVPPGSGYQLNFSSINTLFLADRNPIAVPSSSSKIATLTGTALIGVDYTSFFDWHFSYAYPDCHSNADTFTVTVTIPVDIPDSIYTCDSVVIDASHPNIISYNWDNGFTTPITTFYNSGTYILTMTDGATCTIIDTMVITQPMPVGLPLGNAACDYQLSTNYNMSNASFIWNTAAGDTTSSITIPSTGVYIVTVTTNGGCVLVDTAFISQIVNAPAPNIGNFIDACFVDTLDAGYGGQGMSYEWSTGELSQQIIVDSSGVYAVTVTHPLGCSGTDYVSVNIDTAPHASFTITTNNWTVLMNNTSTGTNQATDYLWEMGDGTMYQIPNPFHTYADSGCYLIRLVVTDACGSDTATMKVAIGVPDTCTIGVHLIEDQLRDIHFKIAPNPNTGEFQLQLYDLLEEDTELQLYDVNGRILHQQELLSYSQSSWDIKTNDLPTGVYFVRLLNRKQTRTERVLILRE